MKAYSNKIALLKNKRGCYSLDTVMGCKMAINGGCYNACYATNYAKRYGYDFTKTISRKFINNKNTIINAINNISMPFVRVGTSGEPSFDWENTINIISEIYGEINKNIVIITKHWERLNPKQMMEISKYNLIINTSISALDSYDLIRKRLKIYNELKNYSRSVLRVITCDFNLDSIEGLSYDTIQNELLKNEHVIDNILRVNANNPHVVSRIIKVKKTKFLDGVVWASVHNKNTYLGNCENCQDMCGVNLF